MIVADASPLNYLILIDEIALLPRLYMQVLIPPAVVSELTAAEAPAVVRGWCERLPEWVEVSEEVPKLEPIPPSLHAGEIEAISLAMYRKASAILIDERSGRIVAESRGLKVIGLLGVLVAGHEHGFVDLRASIDRLRQTSFRISPKLLLTVLEGVEDSA